MSLIYKNRLLAFESWEGVPPIQESRHFFRFDIKFTVDKMPWTPTIHRHYYVSCELYNQHLNLGGIGEDDHGWFVYQVKNEGGMPTSEIQDVASYKDGMSVLINSKSLYHWMSRVKNGLISMQV